MLNEHQQPPKTQRILDWGQTIVGPLVVASILALVGAWYQLGDTVDALDDKLLTHDVWIEQLNTFMVEGNRFTEGDGNDLRQDMHALVEDCESASARIQDMQLEIAKLPPTKWQDRILSMENELRELRVMMRVDHSHSPDYGPEPLNTGKRFIAPKKRPWPMEPGR